MRKDVPTGRSCYVSALRQELIARNSSYAVPKPFAARNQLWRIAGCGLSAIGMRPTPREFHRSQLSSNSQKTRVEKAITESAQPGAALTAREGWLVARTRFFVKFRRAADEHLLLPRRDTAKGGLQNPGPRTRKRPRIWIHASHSVTQRSNRADRN